MLDHDLCISRSRARTPLIFDRAVNPLRGVYVTLWCTEARATRQFKWSDLADIREWVAATEDITPTERTLLTFYRLLAPLPVCDWAILNATERRTAEIRWQIDTRGVPAVVHYTRMENLPGIFRFGLRSRWSIRAAFEDAPGLVCICNDHTRRDERWDSVSVSIVHPNRRQFAAHMKRAGRRAEWAIIVVQPDVLWEVPCLYCHTNAASDASKESFDRTSLEAFRRMFSNPPFVSDTPQVRDYDKPLWQPLDDQAEILVLNNIDPRHIVGVLVRSMPDRAKAVNVVPTSVPVVCRPDMFPHVA